jgi:DNA-directed RNA polymerase subunit beta
MLTVKSDDIVGRAQTFDDIVRGRRIRESNLPASFNVLLNTLRGLALDVELRKGDSAVLPVAPTGDRYSAR